MSWKKQTIDFGVVEKGKELIAEYQYIGDKNITHVHPACGCTTVEFSDKNVTLKYTAPKQLPVYLRNKGLTSHTVTKSATVTFDDKTKELIYLTCTIHL